VPTDLSAELIVADNGSADNTREIVEKAQMKSMRLRHIIEPAVGQCQARNRGLAEAKGEVIIFTDDDVRVPADWIEQMARPILNGDADAVQGGVQPAPHLERDWLRGIYRGMVAIVEPPESGAPESLTGANMAFARRVLDRVRGFQIELGPGASGLGDDTLWGMQLRQAGFRLSYAIGSPVEHHFDESRLSKEYCFEWIRRSGECRALMSTKWLHDTPKHPRAIWAWNTVKYTLRRLVDWRQNPVPPQWCMYYQHRIAYAAKCVELLSRRGTKCANER
jgi:glycosyltransferase involved in cell wall biosynthesis